MTAPAALGPLIIVMLLVPVRRALTGTTFCARSHPVYWNCIWLTMACISPRYPGSANPGITSEAGPTFSPFAITSGGESMRGPAYPQQVRASKGCDSNPNSKVAAWLEVEPMRIKSADNEAVTVPNSSASCAGACNGKVAAKGWGTASCEPTPDA